MIERFSLPLTDPLATADRQIERREGFLVRYDHSGETGIGEATPLPGWTESLTECESALERALDAGGSDDGGLGDQALGDQNLGDREVAMLELREGVPAARHGFAAALLDADARADGVPLYRSFDGSRRCRRVPVNATVGDAAVDATVEAARAAVEEGFDCLKCKVGAREVRGDVERVRAVREAVGDDVTLRVDANGAWTREEAAEAFAALEPLDVSYVEQPLPRDDLSGLADLRGGPIGVAVDETLAARPMADVFESAAADVVVLKPMVLGGPGTAHTLAMRAREEGIEPVVTTTVDAAVARTAAVHVAAAIPDVSPCGLATAHLLAADVAADPAPVEDGTVAVPQDPGIGIEADEVSP